MAARLRHQRPRVLGRAHRRAGRRNSASTVSAGVRDLRPHDMLGYMAYSGMPSHYPHWSYGKSFEKLKTLYDYGVSGLPYEMVINSNPALAYLMRDNSRCKSSPSRTSTGTTTSSRTTSPSEHARRVHDRHLQSARRPRASLRRGPDDRPRQGRERSSTPRTRSRCSAGATWRSRN